MQPKKLPPGFEDLDVVLRNLDFVNNFKAFSWTGRLEAGTEVIVRNALNPTIPSLSLVGRISPDGAGTVNVTDGAAKWTKASLSLRNNGTVAATVTVLFIL